MVFHDPPVLYAADLGGCGALADLDADGIVAEFVGAMERRGATVVQSVSHRFPARA